MDCVKIAINMAQLRFDSLMVYIVGLNSSQGLYILYIICILVRIHQKIPSAHECNIFVATLMLNLRISL